MIPDVRRAALALKPKEEIGAEVHKLDQFFRVEEGSGEAVLDGVRTSIHAGFAVLVFANELKSLVRVSDAKSCPGRSWSAHFQRLERLRRAAGAEDFARDLAAVHRILRGVEVIPCALHGAGVTRVLRPGAGYERRVVPMYGDAQTCRSLISSIRTVWSTPGHFPQ